MTVYRDRLGRQRILLEVTGNGGATVIRPHEHVFNFAGQQEVIRHTHAVEVDHPEHIHPTNRGTSYARFPKSGDSRD